MMVQKVPEFILDYRSSVRGGTCESTRDEADASKIRLKVMFMLSVQVSGNS